MKYTHVYLDAGHGALNPVTKEYTTAPAKMYKFSEGNFHSESTFYEGVKNRDYINRIYQILSDRGNIIPVIVNHISSSLPGSLEVLKFKFVY